MICVVHVKNDDVTGFMIGDDVAQLAARAEFSGYSDLARALKSYPQVGARGKTVLVERTELGGKFVMLVDGAGR